jgi:hypothetical protein
MKTKRISIPKEVFEKVFSNGSQYAQQAINYNKEYMAMTPEQEQLKPYVIPNFPKPPMYDYTNEEINLPVNNNPARYESMAGAMLTPYGEQLRRQDINATIPQTGQEKKYHDTTRVNITTSEFGNPMANINQALYSFGAGDKAGGFLNLGAGVLGGLREGISSYATGKEDKRVMGSSMKKLFERTPNYQYAQQGGLEDQPMSANPNVIAEKGELVIPVNGNLKEINHGTEHVERGKIMPGSPIYAEQGAKIVTDSKMPTQRVTPEDKTLIKDTYGIAVKGKTHAELVKEIIKPLSTKKEEKQLADLENKLKETASIKDRVTAELSKLNIQKNIASTQDKISTLEVEKKERAEFVYNNIQERKPKIGNPGDLFDDNGKKVTQVANTAQQGINRIEELARKHGLSLERAQELIAMQQGGQEQPQEESQEGQMEQVMQAVAQMLQEEVTPEQISEALQIPIEAVEQIVAQLMGGQGEGEGIQEENPQYAQQNTYRVPTRINPKSKTSKVTEKSVLDADELKDIEEWQSFTEGKGYGKSVADVNKFMNTHDWYFNSPEKIAKFKEAVGKKGLQPEVEAFQRAYNPELKSRILKAGLSEQEADDIIKKAGFSKEGLQKLDGLFGGFTSTRSMINSENAKQEDIPTASVEMPLEEGVAPRTNVKNYLYQKNPFLAPNFALDPITKNEFSPRLNEPLEAGIEPFLQNQARQIMTRNAQLGQTGMSPQAIAALTASDAASSQYGANDAISKTQMFNAENRYKTDVSNTEALNRADILNNQYRDAYLQKILGAKANKEADIFNRALTNYQFGEQQKKEALAMNYANAKNDQFAVTPYGIEFLNNKPYEIKPKPVSRDLTAAEELAKKKQAYEIYKKLGYTPT